MNEMVEQDSLDSEVEPSNGKYDPRNKLNDLTSKSGFLKLYLFGIKKV